MAYRINVKLSSIGWIEEDVEGNQEAMQLGLTTDRIFPDWQVQGPNLNGRYAVFPHLWAKPPAERPPRRHTCWGGWR